MNTPFVRSGNSKESINVGEYRKVYNVQIKDFLDIASGTYIVRYTKNESKQRNWVEKFSLIEWDRDKQYFYWDDHIAAAKTYEEAKNRDLDPSTTYPIHSIPNFEFEWIQKIDYNHLEGWLV